MIITTTFIITLFLCDLIAYHSTYGFVRQFLQSPPVIDRKELWRRSEYNLAVYGNFTLTLSRSLEVPTPSYVQILENNHLTVTSFSLLRKGSIMQFDLQGINYPKSYSGDFLWPNELSLFKEKGSGRNILLVPDGFLMPGQSDGGVYAIRDWQQPVQSTPIRLTKPKDGWFYHRAVYLRLPGKLGREGILTARARKPLLGPGSGELVWLALPPQGIDFSEQSNDLPLEEVVLMKGPDVMFETIDLNPQDDSIEVIAAHFFGRKLSIHSMRASETAPFVEITETSTIETMGRPYGLCFATFYPPECPETQAYVPDYESSFDADLGIKKTYVDKVNRSKHRWRRKQQQQQQQQTNLKNRSKCDNRCVTHLLVTTHECSYDIPSAFDMAIHTLQGEYPQVKTIDGMLNKVVYGRSISSSATATSADPSVPSDNRYQYTRDMEFDPDAPNTVNGGSLFAYELPQMPSSCCGDTSSLKPEESLNLNAWKRSTLFRGFKVRGWGGIFSPGAPGFPYVFRMPTKPQSPPLILLAGDCTGSAYLFAPVHSKEEVRTSEGIPRYELAFEIECGATVGSAAVSSVSDGSGDVHLYIPAYELNKVHVFRLSDKEPSK